MTKKEFIDKVLETELTLYHVSKSILQNNTDCKDVVQEAILKAYEKRNSLRNVAFFKTWLVRITINECYSFKRKHKNTIPYEDLSIAQDGLNEIHTNLYLAIQQLDEKRRLPIVLYYIDGYSLSEIARILKIPNGTIKSRLSKGRKEIKEYLESEVIK